QVNSGELYQALEGQIRTNEQELQEILEKSASRLEKLTISPEPLDPLEETCKGSPVPSASYSQQTPEPAQPSGPSPARLLEEQPPSPELAVPRLPVTVPPPEPSVSSPAPAPALCPDLATTLMPSSPPLAEVVGANAPLGAVTHSAGGVGGRDVSSGPEGTQSTDSVGEGSAGPGAGVGVGAGGGTGAMAVRGRRTGAGTGVVGTVDVTPPSYRKTLEGGPPLAGTAAKRSGMPTAALGTPPRLPGPLSDAMVVGAAKEAAKWLAVDDRTWHQAKKFMDDCMADLSKPHPLILKRKNLTEEEWRSAKLSAIQEAIKQDPSLATCRHINRSVCPMDGWTPLHAAAARGNMEVVQTLLATPGVSIWSVDLQGRTALALAAEGGHLDLCILLREQMEAESAESVVGSNAPVDLAGRTPLAWSVRSKSRNRKVEDHLYGVGDASVCPATPAALRSGGGGLSSGGSCTSRGATGRGKSKVGAYTAGTPAAEWVGGGLPCGFSDAPGWRIDMEDAICTHNPVPTSHPQATDTPPPEPTSMFGVFDGHGGSFSSMFVAKHLVDCLQETEGWKSGERSQQALCPAIADAFMACDDLLAAEARMVVTAVENPTEGKQFQ
ncbi:unnamed protein product, partial [Discosporangium mesarthrocarpum]